MLLFHFLFIFYLSFLNVKVRRYFKTATDRAIMTRCPYVCDPGSLCFQEFFDIESKPGNKLNTCQCFNGSQIFICPKVTVGIYYEAGSQTQSQKIKVLYSWGWSLHIYSFNNLSKRFGLFQQWISDRFSETKS